MKNKNLETLEQEKRNLLLAKATIIEEIESGNSTLDKNSYSHLGETVFNIYKLEKKINQLIENIIQP